MNTLVNIISSTPKKKILEEIQKLIYLMANRLMNSAIDPYYCWAWKVALSIYQSSNSLTRTFN